MNMEHKLFLDDVISKKQAEIATLRASLAAALARVGALEAVLLHADRMASYMLDVCHADTDLGHAAAYRASRRSAALAPTEAPRGGHEYQRVLG